MFQLTSSLLALLFSVSGPVMKWNAEIWHSPLAAASVSAAWNEFQAATRGQFATPAQAWTRTGRKASVLTKTAPCQPTAPKTQLSLPAPKQPVALLPEASESLAAKRAGTLTKIGEDAWQSSGGLKYVGLDKNGLNRIEHVLQHVAPGVPGKSVFNVPRNQILGLLDEAYASAARVPVPGDPAAFITPMGRTVGTAGENAVRLILRPGTSEVISAYPVKFP